MDFIPGPIAKQITGDPADIKANGKWENGVLKSSLRFLKAFA